MPTRKVIDRHLKGDDVKVEFAMEFDNIETVKRTVEIEKPEIWRSLGILLKGSHPRSPALREFINLLQGGLGENTPSEASKSAPGNDAAI